MKKEWMENHVEQSTFQEMIQYEAFEHCFEMRCHKCNSDFEIILEPRKSCASDNCPKCGLFYGVIFEKSLGLLRFWSGSKARPWMHPVFEQGGLKEILVLCPNCDKELLVTGKRNIYEVPWGAQCSCGYDITIENSFEDGRSDFKMHCSPPVNPMESTVRMWVYDTMKQKSLVFDGRCLASQGMESITMEGEIIFSRNFSIWESLSHEYIVIFDEKFSPTDHEVFERVEGHHMTFSETFHHARDLVDYVIDNVTRGEMNETEEWMSSLFLPVLREASKKNKHLGRAMRKAGMDI